MELTQNIIDEAKKAIATGRPPAIPSLDGIFSPTPVGDTDLFVALSNDERVLPFGTILHAGVTYRVGPMKNNQQ